MTSLNIFMVLSDKYDNKSRAIITVTCLSSGPETRCDMRHYSPMIQF